MRDKPFGIMPVDYEPRELVSTCCDGTASRDEWQRLGALIEQRPDVADFYVAHVTMQARLCELLNLDTRSCAARPGVERATAAGWRVTGRRLRQRASRSRLFAGAAGVLSLLLVFLLLFPNGRRLQPLSPAQPAIAWVDREGTREFLSPGDHVQQQEGRTVIQFRTRAVVELSGDADLELVSESMVLLHAGQLQADVGDQARGFTVVTSTADVIDLGTVFGVGVGAAGETDVVVFDGEVDIGLSEIASGLRRVSQHNLNTGEAVRVQRNGEIARIPMIWQTPAAPQWSTVSPGQRNQIIASVSDNLSQDSRPKFHAVVPGGFGEDVKAYVDRPHEWNGVDGSGLPNVLVGGDYIRTFNDDRYQHNLELVVTLSRPADIYILFDTRLAAPDWLRKDFADTGWLVGQDEGDYGNGKIVSQPMDIGSGRSIDSQFGVWTREVRSNLEVRLGPVLQNRTSGGAAMYGIVIVPAEARS